jgi:hypothetical protein
MRVILTGIAALAAGFAGGLALPSGERQEAASANAESRAEPSHLSVFGSIHPKRFDVAWDALGSQMSDGSRLRLASLGTDVAVRPALEEGERRSDPPLSMRSRLSFDERFLLGEGFAIEDRSVFEERFVFDQRLNSFEQRFALASVSLAGAAAMTSETEEFTSSVPSVVRLPSPGARDPAVGRSAPRVASLASTPPASLAKKVRLAALEMPNGTLDPESKTAIYDITARTIYMPDGRRLEAHSGLGDRMDDPRYVNVKREGPTPPNVYNLSMRESLFHGVRALRLTPVGDGNMYGRDGILAHSYLLGPNGQSNGCVSFSDYPAFLQAYLRGEVTRIVVVERLANPPNSQFASWFPKSLRDLFSGPDRTQPERATGYAAAN